MKKRCLEEGNNNYNPINYRLLKKHHSVEMSGIAFDKDCLRFLKCLRIKKKATPSAATPKTETTTAITTVLLF